jgi:hypothetical protein
MNTRMKLLRAVALGAFLGALGPMLFYVARSIETTNGHGSVPPSAYDFARALWPLQLFGVMDYDNRSALTPILLVGANMLIFAVTSCWIAAGVARERNSAGSRACLATSVFVVVQLTFFTGYEPSLRAVIAVSTTVATWAIVWRIARQSVDQLVPAHQPSNR